MPLDAQSQAVLDMMAAAGLPPIEQTTPEQAREVRATMRGSFAALAGNVPALAHIEDRIIGGVPVRVYWPHSVNPLPIVVYFHGGGWVLGDIETYDGLCRALAMSSGCIVASVEYRLAPEHPYPAPLDDCYAVTKYISEHAGEFNADPEHLAVAGDSAGGNLAAAVTLLARERGGPAIHFQLLIYPATDYSADDGSVQEYAEDHFLTRAGMRWFWRQYVPEAEHGLHHLVSPIKAKDLSGLPPAFVITAECDVLRDQGEAYARRLEDAGVPVKLNRYNGTIHAFFMMGGVLETGQRAMADAGAALWNTLGARAATAGEVF
jgi:acetyl esterase